MSFNLLLETGDALLLETGGFDNLLLETSPDIPMLILFKTTKLNPDPPDEETTPLFTAKLVDEDGDPVQSGVLEAFLLQVFDESTETVLRAMQDVLNTNDVSIAYGTTTDFQWNVQVGDTRLVDLTKKTGKHVALFEYAWSSEYSGTATDPFTTVSGSPTVAVNLPSHGLTGDDNHLFFVDAENVGGLCFQGSQAVASIVDGNNITITGRANATSSASGGGSLTYFANSQVLKHVVRFTVKRREPIC